MEEINNRCSNGTYSSQILHLPQANISQAVVQEIMKHLINRSLSQINKNQLFKLNLKYFSNQKVVRSINDVNDINNFRTVSRSGQLLSPCNQPKPLIVDSLLAISADIDKENQYKKRQISLINTENSSMFKQKRQPKLIEKKEPYQKLSLEVDIEQDGLTKQMRKMIEQKQVKGKTEKISKDLLDRQELEKAKDKKKKEERFSFDYNGSVIKIKNQMKANLISKLINGIPMSKTNLEKEAFNDPNPSVVDSTVKNQKKSLNNLIKRRDEVEFVPNQSLSEGVSVGVGIKYTYQGKTHELKHKIVTTLELKRTLTQRRLNKQQFQRIKSTNGSSLELRNPQASFRQTKHKRNQSQVHLKSKQKEDKSEKIIVNNQALKEKLMQKINDLLQPNYQQEEPKNKVQYIDQTDIFNINYLKYGGNSKKEGSMVSQSTEKFIFLPKIYRSVSEYELPKERQRRKDLKNVIFEIRNKFNQKLKY